MPLYTYICKDCHNEFDDMKSMAERHTPEQLPCPNCQKQSVSLKMQAPAICAAHRIDAAKAAKPRGDFRERMQQIKKSFAKDKSANIPDF